MATMACVLGHSLFNCIIIIYFVLMLGVLLLIVVVRIFSIIHEQY